MNTYWFIFGIKCYIVYEINVKEKKNRMNRNKYKFSKAVLLFITSWVYLYIKSKEDNS